MDKDQYVDFLKTTKIRPNKFRVKEHKEKILLEQENKMDKIHNKIIDFFIQEKTPNDKQVHDFAEKEGIPPDEMEGHIYMILGDILSGGKSSTFKGTYDPKELAMGINVEQEHISIKNRTVAEKIAKDHLAEIPDYYSRLTKMEKEAGVEEGQHLNELFIQQGEIEAMSKGKQKDVVMLRLSMIAELDASNLYERFAELTSNADIKKVMLDVAYEEKVHAGEFESLVEELDENYEKAEDEGEKEIEDLIKT